MVRAAYSGPMTDLADRLRARGMRLTTQRARVLEAVRSAGHATVEGITRLVAADGGPPLSPSTVYRNLGALQDLGLVSHTHVDHRAPDYHLVAHANHVHLTCRGCGTVQEIDEAAGAAFVAAIAEATGFVADLTHSAVHGYCRACARGVADRRAADRGAADRGEPS